RDSRFDVNNQEVGEETAKATSPLNGDFSPSENLSIKQKFINHLHLFDSFCERPNAVTFKTQEENEEVLLFLRKSQIVNLPWIIFTLFLTIAPLIFFLFEGNLFPFQIPLKVIIILLIFYYLVTITYAFTHFIIWYFNAALITDKRIVDIDFHQLVYKDVAETKMNLVQDISYRQDSVFSNVFDYGHILIQTAGTIENFEFDGLPKPQRIAELVDSLIGKGGRPFEH
ncbi:MAG TPA: hypothetical protein VF189_00500, partial [Patescibacteria group bacterium]